MNLLTETRYISSIFLIEDIDVNGTAYDLRVQNHNGLLSLDFFSGSSHVYSISIKKGITIGRRIARCDHYYDHMENPDFEDAYEQDYEFLQTIGNPIWERSGKNATALIEFGVRDDEFYVEDPVFCGGEEVE